MKSGNSQNNGTLLIFGGGSNGFYKEFMELVGGPKSKIIIIPTAFDAEVITQEELNMFKQRFLNAGFKNVTVLHTRCRKEANSKEFIKPILEADGVWFSGGRHWRLADSYLNTLCHDAFNDLLHRGGVIAGGSAGASIQGSYLVRGDTTSNTIMMGDHKKGLGFIKNVAIDQHLLARNRQFDMFEVLETNPKLLGLGIDEDTAIVVRGNKFQVIGRSYVAVYDGTRWSAIKNKFEKLPKGSREFYLLRAGQEYNLRDRCKVSFKDRAFLKFSEKWLSRYIGKYLHKETNTYYTISIENHSLILQKSDYPDHTTISQVSAHDFFIEDSDFCLKFDVYKNGKVKGFHFLPRNTYWSKQSLDN